MKGIFKRSYSDGDLDMIRDETLEDYSDNKIVDPLVPTRRKDTSMNVFTFILFVFVATYILYLIDVVTT